MLKPYARPLIACCIWGAVCLALPALSQTFNGLKPAGLPLGYWLMAQGAPMLLAIAVFALTRSPGERPS